MREKLQKQSFADILQTNLLRRDSNTGAMRKKLQKQSFADILQKRRY